MLEIDDEHPLPLELVTVVTAEARERAERELTRRRPVRSDHGGDPAQKRLVRQDMPVVDRTRGDRHLIGDVPDHI